VGDFNGDSDPDLAVANQGSDNVSVLLGGAGGSFGAPTAFVAGDGPVSVAVGDFDGDSDSDLAVANSISTDVSVLLNTSKPVLTSSPASLGFGSQTLNTTSTPKGIVVSNSGANLLRISDVRIVGANQLDFDITRDGCEGATIPVGDSCVVRANFGPSAAGLRSASLRITDNAPGSPHSVPLSGTGAVPLCAGVNATIVGTPGSDSLVGTAGNDVVALLGGDDSFSGAGGNDSVCAGSGGDDLVGGPGADTLRGQDGDDQLRGTSENDNLLGGSGDDDLDGGTQTDKCNGGSDIDTAVACETRLNVP
jgi:Ca2+-binding RTX toxin-like protein